MGCPSVCSWKHVSFFPSASVSACSALLRKMPWKCSASALSAKYLSSLSVWRAPTIFCKVLARCDASAGVAHCMCACDSKVCGMLAGHSFLRRNLILFGEMGSCTANSSTGSCNPSGIVQVPAQHADRDILDILDIS